jgi:hypothetical protein
MKRLLIKGRLLLASILVGSTLALAAAHATGVSQV